MSNKYMCEMFRTEVQTLNGAKYEIVLDMQIYQSMKHCVCIVQVQAGCKTFVVSVSQYDCSNQKLLVGFTPGDDPIDDLSKLTEEEFFQKSLVWEGLYCIEFMREVHKYMNECFEQYEGGEFLWEHTVQY